MVAAQPGGVVISQTGLTLNCGQLQLLCSELTVSVWAVETARRLT